MKKAEIDLLASNFPALTRIFAQGLSDGDGSLNKVGSEKSGFTYNDGVPTMYMSRTGKKVVRADMNGIVRMMSQSGYFNAAGGYYTFDETVAAAIGGYPLGAILRWKDPETGIVRTVRSLVPDNKANFVEDPALIDGVNWDFADMVEPASCRPRIFPDWAHATPGDGKELSTHIGISGSQSDGLYTADRPCVVTINAGFNDEQASAATNAPITVWAEVRPSGDESFYCAGLVAYIPPIGSSYQITPPLGALVDKKIEADITYTQHYSPGTVTLWLLPGDTVKLSANIDFDYWTVFAVTPLLAADEMDGAIDPTIPSPDPVPNGGGESPAPTPVPTEPTQQSGDMPVLLGGTAPVYTRPQSPAEIAKFTLPPYVDGEARDIEFVIDWPYEDRVAQLEFYDPSGAAVEFIPSNGDTSMFLVQGVESRTNYFRLIEISPGRFMVYRTNAVSATN